MRSTSRNTHADPWAHATDFNEQMYTALRQSPWWMISVSVHVLVFVVAGLLYENDVEVPDPPSMKIAAMPRSAEPRATSVTFSRSS